MQTTGGQPWPSLLPEWRRAVVRTTHRDGCSRRLEVARRQIDRKIRGDQRPFDLSQPRLYSASSRQPLSMVSECPRPGNSLNSVTAGELRYALSALFTSSGGTVLSFSPETSSSGPRVPFDTLTLVAEFGLKVAVAAWNSGRPGAGIAYLA